VDEIPWLDEDEMRAWRGFLAASTRVAEHVERDLLATSGRSAGEYEVLVHLSEAPGHRRRMADLAERSLLSRSRLTHTVDRLERSGLVEREACEDDRRGTWAHLTDEGFAHLQAIAPAHLAAVRRLLFDHLEPAEVQALANGFARVLAAMGEAPCPGTAGT